MFGFDIHLLIRDIVCLVPGKLTIISRTLGKYIAVFVQVKGTGIRLAFLDSSSAAVPSETISAKLYAS